MTILFKTGPMWTIDDYFSVAAVAEWRIRSLFQKVAVMH